jgi:type I restriction enzyme S subunit
MQDEILKRGTGATVQGIKASLLKTVPLKFPRSLDEQRSIARRCRVAFQIKDEAQNLYRAKLADLDALRQSLLQKAFAGELT